MGELMRLQTVRHKWWFFEFNIRVYKRKGVGKIRPFGIRVLGLFYSMLQYFLRCHLLLTLGFSDSFSIIYVYLFASCSSFCCSPRQFFWHVNPLLLLFCSRLIFFILFFGLFLGSNTFFYPFLACFMFCLLSSSHDSNLSKAFNM